METFNAGLASENLRREAVERATELLARLRRHPVWEEINAAQERYAELPYTYTKENRVENRMIDLLYRDASGWQILDFKTDPILTLSQKNWLVQAYAPQVRRYAQVLETILGQPVSARICFVDDNQSVSLEGITTTI
jgi:ATP-dependent exoDNAse (exonuclease V) beta subunit